MKQTRQTVSVLIDTFEDLYNRACESSTSAGEEKLSEEESRSLEAFLVLTVLLEGILVLLGLTLLKNRKYLSGLHNKERERYGLNNAINDIYLLQGVSTKEFIKLKEFQKDRNNYIHEKIFYLKNEQEFEEHALKLFNQHKPVYELLIEKLERELAA